MGKHVVLLRFTEKGLASIEASPGRVDIFRAAARKKGVTVESALWTAGAYDGVLVLDAPTDEAAAGVVLGLAKQGHVTTCMLRAFEEGDFKKALSQLV